MITSLYCSPPISKVYRKVGARSKHKLQVNAETLLRVGVYPHSGEIFNESATWKGGQCIDKPKSLAHDVFPRARFLSTHIREKLLRWRPGAVTLVYPLDCV